MEEYNLKTTIILHDKYEEIEKEMSKYNVIVTTNPEYSRIILDQNIKLSMQVENENISCAWGISIKDVIAAILSLLLLLVLFNIHPIADLLMGNPVFDSLSGNYLLIFMDGIFIGMLVLHISFLPIVKKIRNNKLQMLKIILAKILGN